MIDNLADVNAASSYGITALFIAALKGNSKIVQKLLDRWAEVDKATVENETPLHASVFGGQYSKQ